MTDLSGRRRLRSRAISFEGEAEFDPTQDDQGHRCAEERREDKVDVVDVVGGDQIDTSVWEKSSPTNSSGCPRVRDRAYEKVSP